MQARSHVRHIIIEVIILILSIGIGGVSFAESSDCTAPVVIVPDGRLSLSTFPQNTTYWFGVYAQSGHSYSVEFESAQDNSWNSQKTAFSPISVFGPQDALMGCRGSSSVAVTANDAYAPVIRKSPDGQGRRVSFTAQIAGLHLISIANVGTSGGYSFRVEDTTMVNPRWSTCGGYFTHWGFLNLSDMTVTGVFTIYDPGGRALASTRVTLAPGTEQFRTTQPNDMNIAPNISGYATFAYNGPPDAVIGDSYMVSGNGAVIYVSRFERPVGW